MHEVRAAAKSSRMQHTLIYIKLLLSKPQYLTFPCNKWIHFLTRFLEVPCEGGPSETLSDFAQKSQISRFIYQELEVLVIRYVMNLATRLRGRFIGILGILGGSFMHFNVDLPKTINLCRPLFVRKDELKHNIKFSK